MSDWLYILGIAIVLDYIYFKLRFSHPKNPPTWYFFPFLGAMPMLLMPNFILLPFYRWYLKNAPNIVLTRMFGPIVLLKEDMIREMQFNEACQLRPKYNPMDFLGFISTGKAEMVYLDGGFIDWRNHRKMDVAAIHALPKRQMVFKSCEVVDAFLKVIEQHVGEVWDCDEELAFSKYQESANLNLGETFQNKEIRSLIKFFKSVFKLSVLLFSFISTIPVKFAIKVFDLVAPYSYRPSVISRIYKELLWRLQQQRMESQSFKEGATDYVEAALRVRSPEKARDYLQASSMFVMAATTHSTHHTIMNLIAYLAKNPHCQEKAHKEITRILKNDYLSVEHLDNMHYMKAMIMEANRLHSPFPFGVRYTALGAELKGFRVPPQTQILTMIHSENLNSKYFADPKAFNPDRFIDENGCYFKDPNIGTFARGRRDCVGKDINNLSSSVYMVKIIKHFKIVAVNPDDEPSGFDGRPFPFPAKMPLRFIRREDAPPIEESLPQTGLTELVKDVMKMEREGLLR